MSARDEFDVAGSGTQVKLAELIGRTVLFMPTEYVPLEKDDAGNPIGGGVLTKDYGRKDVVITDMVVLDADGGPEVYDDVMIFNAKVIGALKRRVGRKYLGKVEYGPEKVKGNFPIVLTDPGEAGTQMGHDYLAGRAIKAALPSAPEADDPFAVKA